MPEEAPSAPPPAAAAQAAAEAAATPPPPAPPEPEPEIPEIPEGDTFDRAYVEGLRGEAAKHRRAKQEVMAHFDGYSDAERTRFLELAQQLNTNPEAAEAEFRAVADRLAKQLGKEIPTMTTPAPEGELTPTPETQPEGGPAALTEADIDRMVTERLEAERQAAAQQDEVAATFAEAEALDPAYKDPAAKAHLFAVAQQNGIGLAEAHELLTTKLQEVIDSAIASHMEGLRTGKHAPRLPSGDPTTGSKPVNWSEVKDPLKLARQRAEERFRATYGS